MIDLTETLPKLDGQIAAFEAEVVKLREVEQNQASLQAELAASKARESEILSDRSSDAKEVAEKLAKQRAFSDTIASRMQDIEPAWRRAYDAGAVAAETHFKAADEFRCRFQPEKRAVFDHRGPSHYNLAIPTVPSDRQRQHIHDAVTEWSGNLRKRFERLTENHKIYAVLRKESLAAAMGLSGQPDALTKPLPHVRAAKEVARS